MSEQSRYPSLITLYVLSAPLMEESFTRSLLHLPRLQNQVECLEHSERLQENLPVSS